MHGLPMFRKIQFRKTQPEETQQKKVQSPPDWPAIAQALKSIVGEKYVIQTRGELSAYECDGLTSYKQTPPLVVLPKTTAEVSQILKLCHDRQIAFVPRGAGTGLSGGALPLADSLLIVTARMNRILQVDIDNRYIVVQPAVINNWVSQAVSGAGFYYAPDPSSQSICSIGGNIAENSGGVHCLKYGVTVNHVLGMTIVLPTGEIEQVGGLVPETPGYDLTGLFVGSEGTLGIATEITLKILPMPQTVQVLLGDFTSIEGAGQAVAEIIRAGIIPAGMEIMDNLSINAVEKTVASNCYPLDAQAILLVEVDGTSAEVIATSQQIQQILQNNGARSIQIAESAVDRAKLWKGRKAAFAAMGKLSPNYYVQDGVIPRSQLPYVLNQIQELGQKYGYHVANVFHAGDGNLHPLILYDQSQAGALEQVEHLGGEILKLCVQVGGSISGEHGIGADKRCYMESMFDPSDLETMQWVRQAFDPQGIANPTKVIPTPATCGDRRIANSSHPAPIF